MLIRRALRGIKNRVMHVQPGLTEQELDTIIRIAESSNGYVLDFAPQRIMAESILHLQYFLEREYFPRRVDDYALVCLIALYSWANYIKIVPGRPPRGGKHPAEFPPVIVGTEDDTDDNDVREVDALIRATLMSVKWAKTYIYIENRGVVFVLKSDYGVEVSGLDDEEAAYLRQLASVHGLFLR